MTQLAIEYNEQGEWLDPGCIMRGTPDKNGMCQPSAKCPSCDQIRALREEEQRQEAENNSRFGVGA
jgi:hypothetical protein